MFDRPFELSFEEGHRQSKMKRDNLDKVSSKDYFQEKFNYDTQRKLKKNKDLVDFERGSTCGGLLTAFVFVGFVSLLVYDLSVNISYRPYTFEVQDKFLTPKEKLATSLNLGDYQQSMDLLFEAEALHENGTRHYDFDPIDNDYIQFDTFQWNTDLNKKEGKHYHYLRKGPELQKCNQERLDKLLS